MALPRADSHPAASQFLMDIRMGIWNFYFIAKLFLYFGHYIGFHVLLNFLFAVSLALPIPYRRVQLLRQMLAVPLGIALFYYDTWLPPISRVIAQSAQLEGFNLAYLMELIGRFISLPVVAGLASLFVVYFFARKKLRVSSFVFLAMLIPLLPVSVKPPATYNAGIENKTALTVPNKRLPSTASTDDSSSDNLSSTPTDAELTTTLNSFYRNEAARSVSFSAPASTDAPFDIVFLQICSLSWDDLKFTQEQDNSLFKRFNIVFTNFNSSASYSGPAAIRLLRGSCGQQKHSRLYDPVAPQCQTFNDLLPIGFELQLAMNHDGKYGGFLADVRERGGLKAALFDTKGVPAYLQSFDGSPVHDDYAVLSKWWEKRLQMPTERVALYYNSISLHDGNRYPGNGSSNSMETYHQRESRLLSDIDRFFTELQASGRRVVVVFIPEHGASIRGDRMQIAGLREIPSPRISTVPVGIKLIGMAGNPAAPPLIVAKPTSYLAISQLLSDFIRSTPFGKNSLNLEDYVSNLQSTKFVAENEDVVVMRSNRQYFIHSKDAEWVEYDPE
ncbi:MAG: cellulose biosynthesis protein BcsG [Gallionella sp.]